MRKTVTEVERRKLKRLREGLAFGDALQDQRQLEGLLDALAAFEPPEGAERARLPLVDPGGRPTGLKAPRWLCHLLGLRHLCVHVVLRWEGSTAAATAPGPMLVLQVRSFSKREWPGCLDLVGGHVEGDQTPEEAAYAELEQELGLSYKHLKAELTPLGSYPSYDAPPETGLCDAEWRKLYLGELTPRALEEVGFRDGEVAGLCLWPEREIFYLLEQEKIPLASGLRGYLKRLKQGR